MSAPYAGSPCDVIHEHEEVATRVSCADLIFTLIKRTLNMNSSSVNFYLSMNSRVMRDILDELRIGAGVFSP